MQKKYTPFLYLTLSMMQSLHSIEEIITPLYEYIPIVTGYVHSRLAFFPVITMEAETFVILNILIITILFFLGPFVFLEKFWTLQSANMVAAIEILNGSAHVPVAVLQELIIPVA